jgi:ribosomal protein S15P/S13E
VYPWLNIKSILHAKPDFFIVGAQKCGTTSLYNYLIQHPCVLSANEKEIHFFSDKYNLGIYWYRAQFPSLVKKYRHLWHYHQKIITGEATPYYLFHPHAATRIKSLYPDSKIIIMLRNPVDRAFSHYRYHVKLKAETLSFEEAIAQEPLRLRGELDRMIADERYDSNNYKLYSYLERGKYIDQIERWAELFPKDQLLIIKSEDFFSDPEEIFNSTLDFLELPYHLIENFKTFNAGKQVSMNNETRNKLSNYYKSYNKRLYDFVGTDFGWE